LDPESTASRRETAFTLRFEPTLMLADADVEALARAEIVEDMIRGVGAGRTGPPGGGK
jgi:hypothetical protein